MNSVPFGPFSPIQAFHPFPLKDKSNTPQPSHLDPLLSVKHEKIMFNNKNQNKSQFVER